MITTQEQYQLSKRSFDFYKNEAAKARIEFDQAKTDNDVEEMNRAYNRHTSSSGKVQREYFRMMKFLDRQ